MKSLHTMYGKLQPHDENFDEIYDKEVDTKDSYPKSDLEIEQGEILLHTS